MANKRKEKHPSYTEDDVSGKVADLHITDARVNISVDQVGKGRIIVNGVDLSDSTVGFELAASVGNATTISLSMNCSKAQLDVLADKLTLKPLPGEQSNKKSEG